MEGCFTFVNADLVRALVSKYISRSLFLHDSSYHSLTLVSMFHSYETVASILGPSSTILADVDHQPKAVSFMDLKDKTLTPSDEFFPHFVENAGTTQKLEGQSEDVSTEPVEYESVSSAEPYMLDLVGDQRDSDGGLLDCTSMKKWPPLTETDIAEISNENGEEVEGREATSEQWHKKESLLTGQDCVETSVNTESWLARHPTKTEGEIKTFPTSSQLDKG